MSSPELPHNIDSEKATLGSVLMNRDALIPIASWLKPSHFYMERHGWVYEAMLECLRKRASPDTINVLAELRRQGRAEAIGGLEYLVSLGDWLPTSYNVERYARQVVECSVLRQVIAAGASIAGLGYDQTRGAEQVLADATAKLTTIQMGREDDVFAPLGATIDAYFEKLGQVQDGNASVLGTGTGFRDLDEITGGLHADELTIVAARPAVGKTSFMLSAAANIGDRGDSDVLIASLEMSRDQMLVRLLAMATRIDTYRLRMLHLNDQESALVVSALGQLNELPVFLADISAMTVEQVRLAALRHIARRNRPVVVMIDYLQLMGSARPRENRVQDVSDISRGLKNLSRELHVPVVALSQLSRAVESRQSHIPMLSDLRESGSLEQDADNVWFLYREELYDKETDKKGIVELHIAKHRQGPQGVVPMRFDAATTQFSDLTYRTPDGY